MCTSAVHEQSAYCTNAINAHLNTEYTLLQLINTPNIFFLITQFLKKKKSPTQALTKFDKKKKTSFCLYWKDISNKA